MRPSPRLGSQRFPECPSCVFGSPPFQLGNWDQALAPPANQPQFGCDVDVEEVWSDTDCGGGLSRRQGNAGDRCRQLPRHLCPYVKPERRIRRSSLSPVRALSAPANWRIGSVLMLSRSIRDPDLIHRFSSRSRCPAPAAVASLLFLISSSPSRGLPCVTNCAPIAHTTGHTRQGQGSHRQSRLRASVFVSCPVVPPRAALDPLLLKSGGNGLRPQAIQGAAKKLQKVIGGADAPPREQAEDSQAETARSSARDIDPASQKPQTDSKDLEP